MYPFLCTPRSQIDFKPRHSPSPWRAYGTSLNGGVLKHDHIAEWRPLCGAVTYAFSTLLPLGGHSTIASHFIPPIAWLRHKFMDRRAYMCLTTRTLAMTDKKRREEPVPAPRAVRVARTTRAMCAAHGRLHVLKSVVCFLFSFFLFFSLFWGENVEEKVNLRG